MAQKEYLIIGSNNFWYASKIGSLREAEQEIEYIRTGPDVYGNPETGEIPDLPERFYIFEAVQVKTVEHQSTP